MTKICRECKAEKPLEEFRVCNSYGNRRGECKECAARLRREYHARNPGKCADASRKWRNKNPEKARQSDMRWKKENSEQHRDNSRRWREENPERVLENLRRWRKENPERYRYNARRWQHQQRILPEYRILCYMRNRLCALLKRGKSEATVDLLGCNIGELKSWLSGWFEPGMTWENYGPVWHVDHHFPCDSFDLSRLDDQRRCFHYLNLRPLFAPKNLSKGAKLPQLAPSNFRS